MGIILKTKRSGLMVLVAILSCSVFTTCKYTHQTKKSGTYKTMEVSLINAVVSSHYSPSVRGKQYVEVRSQISGPITEE
ncbi:hypothetical protein [Dysgonomonas sp.]